MTIRSFTPVILNPVSLVKRFGASKIDYLASTLSMCKWVWEQEVNFVLAGFVFFFSKAHFEHLRRPRPRPPKDEDLKLCFKC